MSSLPEATRSLVQVFNGKLQEFTNEIENIHMVWLEEIQQEAKRMFSRYKVYTWAVLLLFRLTFGVMWRPTRSLGLHCSNFSTEPELMPKTPSQKKTNRRKRVSTELSEAGGKRR